MSTDQLRLVLKAVLLYFLHVYGKVVLFYVCANNLLNHQKKDNLFTVYRKKNTLDHFYKSFQNSLA